MVIITAAENLVHVMVNAPIATLDYSPISQDDAIEILEEAAKDGDRCYVWYHGSETPEIEKVISHKDLCAEEYEFDNLEDGDMFLVFSTQESPHPWWLVVISEIN